MNRPPEPPEPTDITTHRGNALNAQLDILKSPALQTYCIRSNEPKADGEEAAVCLPITFHVGDPAKGPNGVTVEALLAIVIDRMEEWQSGEFKCRENAVAITHLETAAWWLARRMAVDGPYAPKVISKPRVVSSLVNRKLGQQMADGLRGIAPSTYQTVYVDVPEGYAAPARTEGQCEDGQRRTFVVCFDLLSIEDGKTQRAAYKPSI